MLVNISMAFHEDILNGFQVTELQSGQHCILFLAFSRTILRQQGDYRAHYVNRFCDLLRAVQLSEHAVSLVIQLLTVKLFK